MIICVFHRKCLMSIAGNGAGSNIIIMHVYIAPVPGNPVQRRFTISIIPDSDLFNPTHISAPQGVYSDMLPYWCGTNHAHDHLVLSGTHSWRSHPVATWQHCSGGASNRRPFGYGTYALTNCTITADDHITLVLKKLHWLPINKGI